MLSYRMKNRAKVILALDGMQPTWEVVGPHVDSRANSSAGKWELYRAQKSIRSAGQMVVSQCASHVRNALREASPTSTLYAVRLVRVSARLLDSDNLESAFKSLRDGIADAFEVNDKDPRIEWFADQEQVKTSGKHISRIEVYDLNPSRLGRPWRANCTAGRPMT